MPKHIRSNGDAIGDGVSPIATAWLSDAAAPEAESRTDGRFISGRIYNYVYNDVAEQMPSDGSLGPEELAMADPDSPRFRVTRWDGADARSIIGVVSKEPGFGVGVNPEYENPVFVALKGMVWIRVGDREFEPFQWRRGGELRAVGTNGSAKALGAIIETDEANGRVKIFV